MGLSGYRLGWRGRLLALSIFAFVFFEIEKSLSGWRRGVIAWARENDDRSAVNSFEVGLGENAFASDLIGLVGLAGRALSGRFFANSLGNLRGLINWFKSPLSDLICELEA